MADAALHGRTAAPPDEPLLTVRNKWLLSIAVMGAQIMQILDTTIANVALPHMQASLGATVDTITWVLTSYIIATAIALPATGWLSDRIGSRNLLLVAVAGFIVASMLCGTAVTVGEMVMFRVLQGGFAAFIGPLTQTAMIDINRPSEQPQAMSLWATGVMVGPVMGPVIGGFLTENFRWRWVFYVNVPIGLLVLVVLWFLLPSRPVKRGDFDLLGFGLLGTTIAALQLMLDRGQQRDWFSSAEIVTYAFICAGGLWMLVVHLAMARAPLFDRQLYRDRNLMLGMFFMLVVGLATMAPMALLPTMLQQVYGYPVIDTGLMMAPRGVGVMVATFVCGRLMGRVDLRFVIIAGFGVFALSVFMMAHWSMEMGTRPVVISGLIQGVGMGCVFMPINTLAFATLPAIQRTNGSSLLNLLRSMGQSIGVSGVTTLLARNIQVSHADLAQHMSPATFAFPGVQLLGSGGVLTDGLVAMADGAINRQAAFIAYIDDFYMMAWAVLAMAPLVLLLKRPRGPMEVIVSE